MSIENIIKKKLITSYTLPTIKAINTITIKKFPETVPVGSYIYRIMKYPGDIDLLETIKKTKRVYKQLEIDIKKIVKKMFDDKNLYMGDVKVGIDPIVKKLNTHIGKLYFNRIVDYKPTLLKKDLNNFYKKKYITKDDYDIIVDLMSRDLSLRTYKVLKEVIHNLIVLRWNTKEILKSYKILPTKRKIKLIDALKQNEFIKIDMWYWMYDRFVEVTNVFIVGSKINKKEQFSVIKDEMAKYMFSEFDYNPFKSMKRLWILAILKKDNKLILKLSQLMDSGYGLLYQVLGDIKLIYQMNKFEIDEAISRMLIEIDQFKERLSGIYEFEFDRKKIYSLIDNVYKNLKLRNHNKVTKIIIKIIGSLQSILNKETMKYLIKHGIMKDVKIYSKITK